jgi:hypothetical protein
MKVQISKAVQPKQKVLDKICENNGEIVYNDSSLIKAIFPENKIELAVQTYFEISERLHQRSELSGGTRLTVFLG